MTSFRIFIPKRVMNIYVSFTLAFTTMNNNLVIRKEELKDHKAVFNLVKEAFATMEHSDHKEQFLVERLRNSDAFVPELSLIAELENQIVGHVLLTEIYIKDGVNKSVALALAPIAVHPGFQKNGIGGDLINHAHHIANDLGYNAVILLGHADYYPRFGYVPTAQYGIKLPFDVPDENCMIKILNSNAFRGTTGMVEYPKAFFE